MTKPGIINLVIRHIQERSISEASELKFMFIFDAGKHKKKIRGMRISRCENCKRQTPHNLTEVGYFVTALEAPIVPYKKRYLTVCQKCSFTKEIEKNDFEKMLKFQEQTEVESYNQPFEYQKTKQQGKKFCIHCGDVLRSGAKFCNSCGKKVTINKKSSKSKKRL